MKPNLDAAFTGCYKHRVDWHDYWAKAKENLEMALLAYERKKHNVCASRAYYAVFLASVAALHELYPPARGNTSVAVRPEYGVIVHVPLPKRADDRIRLFEQMAEVATRILLDTDEYIILSSR